MSGSKGVRESEGVTGGGRESDTILSPVTAAPRLALCLCSAASILAWPGLLDPETVLCATREAGRVEGVEVDKAVRVEEDTTESRMKTLELSKMCSRWWSSQGVVGRGCMVGGRGG